MPVPCHLRQPEPQGHLAVGVMVRWLPGGSTVCMREASERVGAGNGRIGEASLGFETERVKDDHETGRSCTIPAPYCVPRGLPCPGGNWLEKLRPDF